MTAHVVAFWSGKFTATQQNYPVHEQELLAIKESLERFRNILQGTKVHVWTDHKALEFFTTQKKLSARQTRWMEKINDFDVDVKYIKGEDNVLADALSRLYSEEPEGIVRHKSEYVNDTDQESQHILIVSVKKTNPREEITEPLNVGDEVRAELAIRLEKDEQEPAPRRSQRERKLNPMYQNQPQRKKRTVKAKKPSDLPEGPSPGAVEQETPAPPRMEYVADKDSKSPEVLQKKSKVVERSDDETSSIEPETALTECVTEFALPDSLKGRYKEDPNLAHIGSDPKQYRNFEVIDDVLYIRKDDNLLLCVPDIKIGKSSVREVIITHAHSILAHLGTRKTLLWLRTQVWWKTMVKDVQDFCETCHTCNANKSSTRKPMGLLQAMPVPSYPWQSVGIDFVGPLPESENRNGKFDMIMTVIDNLTRMVHLIATRQEYTAKDIAEIMFEHVYKLHGMPERIVSDRDSLFTATFWKRLNELTKTKLKMSSAYHPQTDGMTERVQRTYTSLLRMCAGARQTEWASSLAAIEFAINSARSESTGLSPFYLNYGRTPSLMLETKSEFPGVSEHVGRIKIAIMAAHNAIIDARAKMTRQANEHRRPAEIDETDLVYISTKNMRMPKGYARKLAPKYVGPYKIARVITPGASYEVELPREMKARGIHPVFHASLLRVHSPSDDRQFPGREYGQVTSLGDTPQEWAVDRIVSHKGKGRTAIFELLWKTGDHTWEPYRAVRHLKALDTYCEAQGVTSVGKLSPGPKDEVEGSEPEDYEVNLLWLMGSEENIEKDEENSPNNPPSPPETYLTPAPLEISTMSNQPTIQLTSESLELILNAQNKAMAESNNAIVRLAGTMMRGRGGKTTHRQRRARARAGEDGESTDGHGRNHPYRHGNRGRGRGGSNAHSPNTHTHTTHTPDLLSFTPVDWHDTSFDTSGSSQFSEHGLLTGAPGDQSNPIPTPENPPVTAYAPSNAGSHASSHAANNTGHPTQPTPSTSHTSATHPSTNAVTETQDTLAVLAAETQVENTEDTVDYGEDYEMDGAEGQGAAAGLV